MYRPDIKAGLLLAGYNQTKLAQELGVSQSAISLCIAGKSRSARVARRIAQLVGRPAATLWPDLYGERGATTRAA